LILTQKSFLTQFYIQLLRYRIGFRQKKLNLLSNKISNEKNIYTSSYNSFF
jgi:hypothetical protein